MNGMENQTIKATTKTDNQELKHRAINTHKN